MSSACLFFSLSATHIQCYHHIILPDPATYFLYKHPKIELVDHDANAYLMLLHRHWAYKVDHDVLVWRFSFHRHEWMIWCILQDSAASFQDRNHPPLSANVIVSSNPQVIETCLLLCCHFVIRYSSNLLETKTWTMTPFQVVFDVIDLESLGCCIRCKYPFGTTWWCLIPLPIHIGDIEQWHWIS